jgi:hypothetical protein
MACYVKVWCLSGYAAEYSGTRQRSQTSIGTRPPHNNTQVLAVENISGIYRPSYAAGTGVSSRGKKVTIRLHLDTRRAECQTLSLLSYAALRHSALSRTNTSLQYFYFPLGEVRYLTVIVSIPPFV